MLNRVKKLCGISDASKDEILLMIIEDAITRIQEYIHDENIKGLEAIIARFAAYLYKSGEGTGDSATTGQAAEDIPTGEVKAEAYSGVRYEYTTSADYIGKTKADAKQAAETYFYSEIVPLLNGRRRIQVIRSKKC